MILVPFFAGSIVYVSTKNLLSLPFQDPVFFAYGHYEVYLSIRIDIKSWRLLWRFNNAAKKNFEGLLVWKVPKCLNSMLLTLHSAILWHCIVDSWVAVHSSSKMGKCQNTSYWLQLLVINSIFVLSMLTFGVNPIEMSPEVEEAFDPDSEEDSYQRFSY